LEMQMPEAIQQSGYRRPYWGSPHVLTPIKQEYSFKFRLIIMPRFDGLKFHPCLHSIFP